MDDLSPNNIFVIDSGQLRVEQVVMIFFSLYIIMLDNDFEIPTGLTISDIDDTLQHLKDYDLNYLGKALIDLKESAQLYLKLDFFEIKVKPVRVENNFAMELLAIPIKKQYQRELESILKMAQKMCDQKNSQIFK